uniref:CARD domain-containing protein n=1 Tax=Plectus sambesii TaxID=2011161 RepID=A0A914ULJ4_9BILA
MWALELGSNSWLQMSDYVLSRDNHAGARYLALCIQQNGECLFHAGLCGTHGCLKGHWYHGDIQSFVIQRQYTIMKYQAATIDEKNVTINYQTELINKKDAKISHQTELIGQKTTTITYQIRLIDEKNATIDHQKALIDEKNTKISDQTEHLNELKKSLKKNQLLKEQANVENRIIEDQLSQATLRKRSLEQQISKSTTEKLQLQSDIAQQQIRVDHLSEEKRRLENENMHMQAKIDKLEYQLKEKIDQIAHINFTQIEQNQKWFVKLASQFPIFRTSKNKEAKIVHNQLQEQEATVGSSNREKQIIKNLQGALLDKTLQLKVANEKLDAATFMMYENSSQKHADHCATPEARPRTEKREVTRKRYAESTHHQVLKTSKTEEKPSHVLKNDEKSEDETLGHIATGMCKQDNRRLIKNLPYLCHTVDHLMVSTTLLSKAIFTQHEVELISQESTSYSKRLKLINILTTKGSNAFPAFITALNDAGQNFISNILLSSSKTDDKNPSSNLVDASEPENQGTFHERDIPFIDGNETEQQSASAIKYEYVPASREFLSSTAAMLNITLNISSIIIR